LQIIAENPKETEQSGDEEEESVTATDDEREPSQPGNQVPPRENVFGAKIRSASKDIATPSTSASATSAPSKPSRQTVKHPFKAVASTHVRLQKQFHVPQH